MINPDRASKGVRQRLLPLLLIFGLAGPLIGSSCYTFNLQRNSLAQGLRFELGQLTGVLANGMSEPIWHLVPDMGKPLIDRLMRDKRVISINVASVAQGEFATMSRPGVTSPVTLLLMEDVMRDGDKIGSVTIGFDTSTELAAIEDQWRQIIVVIAIQLLLSLAVVFFVMRISERMRRSRDLTRMNAQLSEEVAERRQAEIAARESAARLNLVINSLPVLVVYLDTSQRYIFVNRTAEEWYAIPSSDILGRTPTDIFGPAFRERREKMDAILTGQLESYDSEGETIYPDGVTRQTRKIYVPNRDSEGRIAGLLAMVQDISAMKQAEERLRQAHKMEAVGQLTGGVAHDFNNLLTTVLGNLELITEGVEDRPDLSAMASTAMRAVERGGELTHQLLAFSRQQELRRVPVNFADIVREMKDMLSRTLDDDIDVVTEETRSLWPCETDPAQVQNAILNLAINAADAMPDGGTLWIETNNLTLDASFGKVDENFIPGDYIRLAVTDTGSGMSADVLEHAFEPFYTTKEVGKGSGLGLSMIYGFIRQSGGYIRVNSKPQKGTTVALYLPRSDTIPAAPSNIVRFAQRSCGQETVLLVDDQADVRRIACRILENLGYRVIEASDGPSALHALELADHVDLLFTDVVMPGGLNGVELANEALSRVPGLKILFATGYSGEKSAVAETAGIDAMVLAKPYRRADVAQAVEETLAR